MPGMVGGFGKINLVYNTQTAAAELLVNFLFKKVQVSRYNLRLQQNKNEEVEKIEPSTGQVLPAANEISNLDKNIDRRKDNKVKFSPLLGSYLAGLIEGDGTFAVHNKDSISKSYSPKIIVCFKLSDLPLANYLQTITQCGIVYTKKDRGYVLWQISKIEDVYTIVTIINGHMRSPKIEALNRAINWINLYKEKNKNSKLPSTIKILENIEAQAGDMSTIQTKPLNTSPIESDAWLAGFTDADANFSINITKRKRGNFRLQLFYRIEVAQIYTNNNSYVSIFELISKLSLFLNVNVLTRTRKREDKEYHSFIVMATSKESLNRLISYFEKYPLLSSKHLDYLAFCKVKNLQKQAETDKATVSSYIEEAKLIRNDFNKTRTSFTWDHLKKTPYYS